jgi:hypothetical protein
MDLYKLNELDKVEMKPQEVYHNSISQLSSSAIFIKAIIKTIEKVKNAADYLKQVVIQDDAKLLERSLSDSQMLVKFMEELDAASKILEEFQKATSVLQEDDSPELIDLSSKMHQGFATAKIHINMFAITKNLDYHNSALSLLDKLLFIFQNMDQKLQEESE